MSGDPLLVSLAPLSSLPFDPIALPSRSPRASGSPPRPPGVGSAEVPLEDAPTSSLPAPGLGGCILSVCPTHSHPRWKSEHAGQEASVSPCGNSRSLGPGRLVSSRFTIPLGPFFTPLHSCTPPLLPSPPLAPRVSLYAWLTARSPGCTRGSVYQESYIKELLQVNRR
jgi:hypothetical protein